MLDERTLDETDRKLIHGLIEHPRATHRKLAADLGVNEVTVASRLQRLVNARIMATTIAVDWSAAGYARSMYCWLACAGRPIDEIGREIGELPGVQNVVVMLGPSDLFAQMLLTAGDDSVLEAQAMLSGVKGATLVETNLVLRHYVHELERTALPVVEPPLPELPNPVVSLDEIDVAICEHLAEDGRRSNREIGRSIGVSERTVRARTARLQDAGLIRIVTMVGASADYRLSGGGVSAFVGIRIEGDSNAAAALLEGLTGLSGLTATTGDAELYAILTAADVDALADLVVDEIRSLPMVRSTTTWIVGRALKYSTRLRRLL